MTPFMLAAVLTLAPATVPAPAFKDCPTGCVEGGCWVLVMRYTVNLADIGQRPRPVTMETFTEPDYPSEEAAYCAAEQIRLRGVKLPTLERFGRDSNVVPESITPMPAI